jgi:Right handed beta helix region
MEKSLTKSARIALGVTVLGALALGGWGCGSSNHANSNPDAKDAKTGSAGSDATGTAGSGGTGGATAGNDGGSDVAGAGGTGVAGTDGGAAGADATGAAGTDGGAAGTDGGAADADATGAAGTDGGAADADATGAAGADAAADADGGVSDASDASDAGDASDASDAADVPCTNACTLGAKQCGGSGGIQTCVMGSSTCTVWSAAASCGLHSSCSVTGGTAACGCNATTCTVVGEFCSSTTARTDCGVDSDGCFFATAAPVACGQRQTCTGVAGSATCTCSTDPSCASGTATFCASGSSQSSCGTDQDGCFFVASTTACPAHESCKGNNPTGACSCDAPPTDCGSGVNSTFCATSSTVSTCRKDANNCLFADAAVACGTHQTCTGASGVGACGCVVDTNCSAAGDVCVGSSSVHCAKDTDNCFFTQTTAACGSRQSCNTGNGLCECNVAVCSTAGKFCDLGGNLATCSQDVNSCFFENGAPTACPTNQSCTGAPGSAACTCNPAPAICSKGAGTYCDAGGLTTCVADGAGCVTVGTSQAACGTHQTCTGTAGAAACACNAAPTGCTGNGPFCTGTGTQSVCQVDVNNCPFSDAGGDAMCPANETCKGSTLGTTCTCDNTCTATQAGGGSGTYCLDLLHQSSCNNDAHGCHIASNTQACVGIQTCQGADGAGACQCQPLGVTAGTGCTTLADTVCQGNTVLTCINDTPSGCHYWAQPTDCTASSFVCGTKSGVAACQCADHAGTDYFADPVAGSDAQTGIFPTGIDSPAECRFGTLGKALSLATTAGDRVVATTAAPPHPFAGETFPLTVSAGVTLTTSDTVLTPGNYTIDFGSGAGASAISLGNSSIVEGFTVASGGGNGAASGISITGTGATVDTVVIEGAGPLGSGIKVTGSGLINAATVHGAVTGVSISTASAVTLQNSSIDTGGTGISLANGSLVASSVTVDGNGANGIVVSGATASLTGTSLTVDDNAGTGIVQTGGSATLTLKSGDIFNNSVGGISLSAGAGTLATVNVHDNTGAGITQSGAASTITLGSGGATTTVHSNTGTGVTISGGTLTVGTTSITGNGSDGVAASGIATLVSNTGASYTSNGGNGINATSSTLTFNGSAAAPISVSNNTGDGILMTGGGLSANYLTLGANGTGATKKSGLAISGVAAVNLGTATDAALSFTGNGLNGVTINGTTAGSAIDMRRAQITGNTGDGVSIDLNGGTGAGAATATLTTVTTSNNGGNGVEVLRAPLGSATACTIDGLTATSNTGSGVYLRGNLGNIVATVKNSKLTSNTKFGVLVEQGAATTTQENLQSNDITLNTAGGIAFNTSSTLNGFSANTIHHNGGDQILVAARQNGLAAWNFASASACDANRNQVWCYAGAAGSGFNPAGVGIRVTGLPTAPVAADFMSWAEAVPVANTDYITSGTLTKTGPCAAQTACP